MQFLTLILKSGLRTHILKMNCSNEEWQEESWLYTSLYVYLLKKQNPNNKFFRVMKSVAQRDLLSNIML